MTIFTFNDLSSFDFTPRRGVTGLDIAPPRPAAVAHPDEQIAGFADAQARIQRATSSFYDLQHDLAAARATLAAIEQQHAALVSTAQRGTKISTADVAVLDIERQAAAANIQLLAAALGRAENDVRAARQNMKTVLRSAATDFLHLIREHAGEASAEARRATAKANALESWARDVASALQHQLEVDDLVRLLGVG